jgi:putative copper export protein
MAPLLSLSADAFSAHPHVLDATLGRALAYLGSALLFGMRLWLATIRSASFVRLTPYRVTALLAGLAGALLVTHGALVEAIDPFALAVSSQESTVGLDDYLRLLHTSFGAAWIAYSALLVLGVLLIRHPLAWLMALGSAAALAASSHAGELGLPTPGYVLGLIHLVLALLWLGGLAILAAGRLGESWHAEHAAVKRFSRFALPTFALILLSGVARLTWQVWLEQGLSVLYLVFLGLKLFVTAGIMFSAWRLRHVLQHGAADDPAYDHQLGSELFFAALLVFTTALLTQIPPN